MGWVNRAMDAAEEWDRGQAEKKLASRRTGDLDDITRPWLASLMKNAEWCMMGNVGKRDNLNVGTDVVGKGKR